MRSWKQIKTKVYTSNGALDDPLTIERLRQVFLAVAHIPKLKISYGSPKRFEGLLANFPEFGKLVRSISGVGGIYCGLNEYLPSYIAMLSEPKSVTLIYLTETNKVERILRFPLWETEEG